MIVIIVGDWMEEHKDYFGEYDFSRSDKLYSLKIPTYSIENGTVFYQFHLKDLIYN